LIGLFDLSANSENEVKIADVGGIDAVLRALAAHPAANGLQQRGRAALRILVCLSGS
jgi:hypothetical protein